METSKASLDGVEMNKTTSKLGTYGTPGWVQERPAYCLGGVRHKGGVNLNQAFVWNVGTFASRGCKRDGGRPSEVGMQVQISNHLKLLWSKTTVVSIEEKAYGIRQV